VIAWVRAVPHGRVVTYGQVATLAGSPGAARQVSGVLRRATRRDETFPWHRVVNARGGISTFKVGEGELQTALLQREGVPVVDGVLPLDAYLWQPVQDGPKDALNR
jgi:methylated-DNA-protein-cysteine methyltransferase-like protein